MHTVCEMQYSFLFWSKIPGNLDSLQLRGRCWLKLARPFLVLCWSQSHHLMIIVTWYLATWLSGSRCGDWLLGPLCAWRLLDYNIIMGPGWVLTEEVGLLWLQDCGLWILSSGIWTLWGWCWAGVAKLHFGLSIIFVFVANVLFIYSCPYLPSIVFPAIPYPSSLPISPKLNLSFILTWIVSG